MIKDHQTCYKAAMPIRVFIFEDHWMCREALVAVLGKADDIQIVGAVEEVQEGFRETVKLKPDVVLMDVLFHGVRLGIQTTAAIKKALPETKVVVFTEFPDEDTLRNAVKAGASGFLLKKEVQDPDIIVNAIRTVHHGHAYLTPLMTEKILNVVRHASEKDGYELTRREREILQLINEGKSNKAIARELSIDIRTVANHVNNLLYKMDAKNRTEAAAIARKEGLID